ncbi:MFS transporter [Nocardia sp. NPDC057663]|uniref:MFS transporter n=1 Tax=Nocardia sp. NPDC057663 TaxID=3346201 RepID=UPI003670E46A
MHVQESVDVPKYARYALIPAVGISKLGTGSFTVVVLFVIGRDAGVGTAGIVLALSAVPAVIFGLLGGVFADQWEKRRLLLLYDAASIVVCALPCILFLVRRDLLGNIKLVVASAVVISFICAVSSSLYAPTSRAIAPFVVHRSEFARYNGMLTAAGNVAQVCGPLIGGLIIVVSDDCYVWALAMNTGSFVISFLITLRLPRVGAAEARARRSIFRKLLEAAIWVKDNRPVRRVVLTASILYFLLAPAGLIVLSRLSGTEMAGEYLSLCQAFQAFGSIAFVVVADRVQRKDGMPSSMGAICVLSATMMLMLATSNLMVYLVSSFGIGLLSTMVAVSLFGVIQGESPPSMVGRTIAIAAALSGALIPVGLWSFGQLVAVSSYMAIVVSSASLVVLGLAVHLSSRKVLVS